MKLEYWVQQVAMGEEVQERSRREGCGPEWRLSAARSNAEVDDERRWNQVVRVLGVVCFGERFYVALARSHLSVVRRIPIPRECECRYSDGYAPKVSQPM
jgi:hypothetical protein